MDIDRKSAIKDGGFSSRFAFVSRERNNPDSDLPSPTASADLHLSHIGMAIDCCYDVIESLWERQQLYVNKSLL